MLPVGRHGNHALDSSVSASLSFFIFYNRVLSSYLLGVVKVKLNAKCQHRYSMSD